MARLPLCIVKEMFFTAGLIEADRAERAGLINMVVPAAELESRTYAMAKMIASRSAASVTVAKESLNLLSQATPLSPSQFEYIQGMRRAVYFGPDYHEGVQAFLQKRAPQFLETPGHLVSP